MDIREFMQTHTVMLDGAMGTMLHKRGLALTERSELVNLTSPGDVTDIHRLYFDAGANVVCTNTFGANPLHYDEQKLDEIIKAAFDNAKAAKETSAGKQEKFIALDIGPSGRLLKPFGDLDFEEAVSNFAAVVRAGVKYGADLIFIETMNDGYETKAALLAAKENSELPVFVSNAYGENGKLMTGGTPEAVIAMLEGMGADAVGVNCSFGPDKLLPVVERYLKYASVPVIMKPNAGLPHDSNGYTVYDLSVDDFVNIVSGCIKKGVAIAGGCCGTTPEHIKALAERAGRVVKTEEKSHTCVSSYSNAVFFGKNPVLIGERINPTGKKRFKQALVEGDIDYILNEGIRQRDAGVHILDVNVGLPQINEAEMLQTVVSELQAVVDIPLQIDTSSADAMEAALRVYNGCPMINSVNGKRESMESVFPLVKKYGGVVVALTLDENGIPDTAEKRYEIAEKIVTTAEEYGIKRKNIVFDTLTMTVSTDKNAARVTLDALKLIKDRLGCHTVLGVSNVSFGLPSRGIINSVFFTEAMYAGLSAAIMNPFSDDMMKSYHGYRALNGLDDNFSGYIAFAENAAADNASQPVAGDIDLYTAIISGLKEQAGKLAARMLECIPPYELIEKHVIPALDSVGKSYETGKTYLPQLLMAAEAAQSAFEQVKLKMPAGTDQSKGIFVLATVEGDIHDIGKNIVKLLLQNYGFEVHDLGKDVPAERVRDEVIRLHAPFAGLSALMTTTVPSMEKTVKLLHKEAPFCRVIVGGAVLTEEYAKKIGADKYAKDAMETVRYSLGMI